MFSAEVLSYDYHKPTVRFTILSSNCVYNVIICIYLFIIWIQQALNYLELTSKQITIMFNVCMNMNNVKETIWCHKN